MTGSQQRGGGIEESGQGYDNEEMPEYGEDELDEVMMNYDPDQMIDILGEFIEEKKNKIVLNNQDQKKKKSLEKEKKEKQLRKEKRFWEKMTRVLPEDREMMWNVGQIILSFSFLNFYFNHSPLFRDLSIKF